ncbi:MAG: NAD-dependent epimerase/dehydratase family protein [Lentimicrobium sp.]|nr:NAD-dependent epimerase/dehydratase family protein [Lentimicrobiaceae bacterium]MCO5264345.1 NAD-dependent epimerase/dehydratase family protein [Lentimicrobium sp.]
MTDFVVVTGANGYLGSYVVREFLRQGIGVIACRFKHYASVVVEHPDVMYVETDISLPVTENSQLEKLVKGKQILAVVNVAALLGSADYDANLRVNAHGVQHMMDFARLHQIKRFVQISSVVVMKEIKGPYGVTKLKGQELLVESELDYTVFIPAMIMGPESLGLNRVLKNVFRFPFFVPLIGNGKETQHPVYVKDFARAIVASVQSDKSRRKVYQIAGDTVLPFRDFIRLILKHYGKRRVFIFVPAFVASMLGWFFSKVQKVPLFTAEHVKGILQNSRLDTSMLVSDLNYQPTPLVKALDESLDVIQTNWNFYLAPREESVIKVD